MDPKVQREHHFAIVDEADNIFIDEASTPLIISCADPPGHAGEEQVVYHWADQLAQRCQFAISTSPSTRRSRRSS